LTADGAIVSGFGRASVTFDRVSGLRWIHGEFNDPMALARACESQNVVFHLLNSSTAASATREPVGDITANVVPSVRLLEACRDAGVQRFILASSGGTVYGAAEQIPTVETAQTLPISAYGISKLAVEHYTRLFEDLHGLDYRILRVSNPYGPGQSPFKKQGAVAAFMYALIKGQAVEIWGDGSVVRDYIYVDDVSAAFVEAMRHRGPERVFNVSSGIGRTLIEIYGAICRVLGDTDGRIIWKDKRPVDVPVNILDHTLMTTCTRWRPGVDLDAGLHRTAAWMRTFVEKHDA
jgi:UDP-glucose 4-epimerase